MRALDLFCCAGGASDGLVRAGFTVCGIDLEDQPECRGENHHAVGGEKCAPGCIDAEIARDREAFDGDCSEDEEGYYGG